MLMTDLICKKRDGGRLTTEEINFIIEGYTNGSIPDYQMSALCMAIVFRGMDDNEILDLTLAMMNSGDTIKLDHIEGIKADKHSTGGVGDKTSLVLCPMVAACGIKIAKMSGRGLGHTGGTIDKLESFPGFVTGISEETFYENVKNIGIAIAAQTANLDPADKKLYALRDVTGTVPSIPLIVSSIMSKKLASGADVIVLDVKSGSGSFMKNDEQALELARGLTRVGRYAGKKCAAVITDMDEPLGFAIGNALEVKEAIRVLSGESAGELRNLCLTLGSCILTEAGIAADEAEGRAMLEKVIEDGSALKKLAEMVKAQGGDERAVYDVSLLPEAPVKYEVRAAKAGWVAGIDAEEIGLVSMHLGGGRVTKESDIDLAVGLVLKKKVGDHIAAGDVVAVIHAQNVEAAQKAEESLLAAYRMSDEKVIKKPFIKATVR